MTYQAPFQMPDAQWRSRLNELEYRVLRASGTEAPFTGEFTDHFATGIYACRGCEAPLFTGREKFPSHCGWPSFFSPLDPTAVRYLEDESLPGRPRVEVRCANCDSHLGHVFKGEGYDTPTDLRYCINSVALTFTPTSE